MNDDAEARTFEVNIEIELQRTQLAALGVAPDRIDKLIQEAHLAANQTKWSTLIAIQEVMGAAVRRAKHGEPA
jgi:hypothetical protein